MNPQIIAGEQGRMKIDSSLSPCKTASHWDVSKRKRKKKKDVGTMLFMHQWFLATERTITVNSHSYCFMLDSQRTNITASICPLSLRFLERYNRKIKFSTSDRIIKKHTQKKSKMSELVIEQSLTLIWSAKALQFSCHCFQYEQHCASKRRRHHSVPKTN